MRKRAGALIIQDKKLLLISEKNQDSYWTPGGGVEAGEDYHDALVRELQEELDARTASAKLFYSYVDTDADEEVHYFLVSLASAPNPPDKRTKLLAYSREDFEQGVIPISKRIYHLVYPELIAAELV